jgi:hypothetical protein
MRAWKCWWGSMLILRRYEELCCGGSWLVTKVVPSSCNAACVHVRASSISAFFSFSVVDVEAQRRASAAYCRNSSAFDMARFLITGGSATDAHATDDAGDGKRLHVAKRGVGHLSYRIALKPPGDLFFAPRRGEATAHSFVPACFERDDGILPRLPVKKTSTGKFRPQGKKECRACRLQRLRRNTARAINA